ncbi:MAG: HDIG domain-containing protein [bacterium]|uniref:HDIG domain-containing protein n=1 Tax=Candidatus Methylomirabilis tolerans TaxID=3123416 RepID=A0AAJ1ALF7_9BACT|nr:HDIG domain-containing protein [Candidatus Methylomirabilis sp.]
MAPDTNSSDITTSMQSPAVRRLLNTPRMVSSWFHWTTERLEHHPSTLYALCSLAILAIILLIASSSALPSGILSLLGVCLLVGFLLGSLCLYIWTLQPKLMRRPKSLFLLTSVILLTVALTRSFFLFLPSIHQALPTVPASALEYSIPVALGGLLLAILFNSRLAFAGALAISILTSLLAADGFRFFLYSLVSSLAAIFALVGQKDRAILLKAGVAVGLANLYSILTWSLLSGVTERLGFHLLCGLVSGLFVAILSLGLLPLFEYLFEMATDFRLLELCNLNHPLLKEMILKAPGTYHHSIVVGTLAEAAAEAIGANTMLCRVGAYYHDIGKITKPSYFVENQQHARSRHEKLGPSLSSLVIVSHVKAGMELGRAYGLPQTVLEMIPQHHGTRLILYFYHKAKGAEESDQGEVQEEKFRYPGPKPQTKEAAILMLADAVEAASQTLTERTPGRFQALVAKIVNAVFVDGQLRECELTFSELRLIEESFVRILCGIYHRRVEYPGFTFEESAGRRGANGDAGHKPAKEDQARHEISKKGRGDRPRHGRS